MDFDEEEFRFDAFTSSNDDNGAFSIANNPFAAAASSAAASSRKGKYHCLSLMICVYSIRRLPHQ